MSADGDTVRAGVRALPGGKAEAAALAALARLEAAARDHEDQEWQLLLAQRDALAEALRRAREALDAEEAKLRGWYEDCKEEGSLSEAAAYGHKIDGINIARAALAETGLE